jgi:hypothetical protein
MRTSTRTHWLAALGLLLTTACASSGYQRVPMPASDGPAADRCRVYVVREDARGSLRNVRVLDGETEIGLLEADQYLCWDRLPQRGVGTALYEGVEPKRQEVENVFDLPREPGSTGWFAVSIERTQRQPRIRALAPEEGRALVAQRQPAPVR